MAHIYTSIKNCVEVRTCAKISSEVYCSNIDVQTLLFKLDQRKFTFSQRVVNMWNNLLAEVVTASSVKMFKNKLEAHLKNLPRRSPE